MTDQSHAALCKGVMIPHSPFLNETRIKRMQEARYEGEEIAGALSVIGSEDRVLEMGAGLGVVGAVIAHNAKPEAVLSFEANPNLIPHIQSLYALNKLETTIEVRNQVVWAAPARPETVTFHLRSAYLASSLIKSEKRETTPVEVPTAAYSEVLAEFRPTVLVIDIEGGELDFLQHADLEGVRAIVIEFHPDHYGKTGAIRCKDILRYAGFRKVDEVSTRFVWTCLRDRAHTHAPRSTGGWSTEILEVDNAVVVPPTARSHVQAAGILNAEGEAIIHGGHWQKEQLMTTPPALPQGEIARLEGKWLWCGVLWRYFPHFITESISRLWALDQIDQQGLDGLIFVPKNPLGRLDSPEFHKGFLQMLGTDLPIRLATKPVRPDKLVIPGQGFGLGEITRGTDAFRAAFQNRFGKGIAADGPEKLYVSRSKLGPQRGALLGETYLERFLEAQGYEVFHPQDHSLEVQTARYRAARKIISVEGSALHLYAFAGGTKTDVAMILRRKSISTQYISTHIQSFTGRAPIEMDTLRRTWLSVQSPRKRLAIGEPDFPALQQMLIDGNFIQNGPTWHQPEQAEMQELLGSDYYLDRDGLKSA